ncbi:MAG: hypothetical protein AAF799_41210 [Myxococcota bacterium]
MNAAALLTTMAMAACNGSPGDGGVFNDGTDATTGQASPATSSSSGALESTDTRSLDETGVILDVGDTEDLCGCQRGFIWIANSEESTLSKIDTQTLEEVGRYRTRADLAGSPSRTSVSFTGDVVVANRYGGLAKFYADPNDCVESNGTPGIQTSSGAGDVLPFAQEECRAWFVDFPTSNQRPVAWAPPEDPKAVDCDAPSSQRLWTVGSSVIGLPGIGGPGGATAWLVDGDDGSILETVEVPEFMGAQLGAYGGAVNGDGDLYFSTQGALTLGNNQLVRVDIETLEATIWMVPAEVAPYGITVDHNGRVWLSSMFGASAARFDPETETWDIVPGSFTSQAGLMEHPSGQMWIGTSTGAIEVDVETLELGNVFVPAGGGEVKGISIDGDGFVWAVNGMAHKFDPASGALEGTYNGLSSPYTYSDMTGWALQNTTCPPVG